MARLALKGTGLTFSAGIRSPANCTLSMGCPPTSAGPIPKNGMTIHPRARTAPTISKRDIFMTPESSRLGGARGSAEAHKRGLLPLYAGLLRLSRHGGAGLQLAVVCKLRDQPHPALPKQRMLRKDWTLKRAQALPS